MTKIAVITGIAGTDIDSYLENERDVFIRESMLEVKKYLKDMGIRGKERKQELELERKNLEEKIKIYHIGEVMRSEMHKEGISFDFRYILQCDDTVLRLLTKIAWAEVDKDIKKNNVDVALIKAHATFYDPQRDQFRRGISVRDIGDMEIDKMCCIIDDELMIKDRLKNNPQYQACKLTNSKILNWISDEVKDSEALFENLRLQKDDNDRMQVFSRYLSTTSLYKYLMFDNVPVIYTIYPITHIVGNKKAEAEIDSGIWLANTYGIVKNPKAGDVATITTGKPIVGIVDKKNAAEDDMARAIHCTNRDLSYLVEKCDIIFGNYPTGEDSDGMISEMWKGFNTTKLVILKVGEDTPKYVSPFRTFPARYIERTYSGIKKALKKEGYSPRFKSLMNRWQDAYFAEWKECIENKERVNGLDSSSIYKNKKK